ncbi:MAG: LuxR C-terminal-related transcriptional regulator [Gammaproteobacteria bacterium]
MLSDLGSAVSTIRQQSIHFLVIDAHFFDADQVPLPLFSGYGLKSLIIGHHWTEEKQLDALVAGHSGYCEAATAPKFLLKATNSILNGDIWVNRHLVPKVIELVIKMNTARPIQSEQKKIEFKQNLQTLTHRELDVAKMITTGNSNKMIARLLNISERTVKAHLTSIFQKLNVQDRLHLAILFKEFS